MKLIQVPKNSFPFLLSSLLLYQLVAPYIMEYEVASFESIFLNPFLIYILLASLYTVTVKRKDFITGLCFLAPVIIANSAYFFHDEGFSPLLASLSYILYFGYISFFLTRYLVKSKVVSLNILFAAVCLYLFMAYIWAFIYIVTDSMVDNAFYFSDGLLEHGRFKEEYMTIFTYYSFVTITTLGYGDISPLHPIARTWVSIEAVIGQLYLTIIMARLVSLYVGDKNKK